MMIGVIEFYQMAFIFFGSSKLKMVESVDLPQPVVPNDKMNDIPWNLLDFTSGFSDAKIINFETEISKKLNILKKNDKPC